MDGLSQVWLTLSMSEMQPEPCGWHWEGTCSLGKATAATKPLVFLKIPKTLSVVIAELMQAAIWNLESLQTEQGKTGDAAAFQDDDGSRAGNLSSAFPG